MRLSWKRFNEIAKTKGWTPVFKCHRVDLLGKPGNMRAIWVYKEHPLIEAVKPKGVQ